MTDAAERAADAEQAEVEALNWQAEQQRATEAMRAVFAAVLAETVGLIQNGQRIESVLRHSGDTVAADQIAAKNLGRGEIGAMLMRHAAAAGVELE